MAMRHRRLGANCGVRVSPLCLGTMNFGPVTSEQDAFAIMDRALEEGINFFDTANVYGRKVWNPGETVGHPGLTEEIIGRWFAQGGGRRERVVLATKVYGGMQIGAGHDPDREPGLSARKIILSCEESLRRLRADAIDLYQMHHIDRDCPVEEVFEAFDTLKKQGKAVYTGSSNFAGWDIARYGEFARRAGVPGLVSEQSVYSLQNRAIEAEVVPACRHYGLGIIPWSPLGGGLLGGIIEKTKEREGGRRGEERMQGILGRHRERVERYEALCRELGESPAVVALAWLLHNPVVTAPIIGPRTVEQLASALRAAELKLSDETLARLDEIWPGPGGEAPKNYAW